MHSLFAGFLATITMAFFHFLGRFYNGLITWLAVIGGAIFGLMAFFIGADVVMRNLTGSGLAWVIELTEYAMYVATVFAAPWVLREGAHVSVDAVTANLPRQLRRRVAIFTNLLGSVICFIIFYYSLLSTWTAFVRGNQIYKTFTIPEWWVNGFVPLGMLLVGIEFLLLAKAGLSEPAAVPAQ